MIILSLQTRRNLQVLALVALATLFSPPQSWKQPRNATEVSARPLCRIGMFLPVLIVRRSLLD